MSPNLNTRARLERALRNNQKIYSAWETFRKFKWFTLGIVFLLPIYPTLSVLGSDYEASAASDYDESTIITAYTGDEGDSVSYISENGMISTDFDTSVSVPQKAQEKKAKASNTYVVAKGDSIEKIAAKYNISTDAILWANDMEQGDDLIAGSTLRIPPVSGVVYTVESGDTLSEIASKYRVEMDDIVRVNNLRDAASIRNGMDLMIPGAARSITPPKPTQVASNDQKPKASDQPKAVKKPTIIQDSDSGKEDASGIKSRYSVKYTGLSRGFAWGNCTWYVAQHKNVTWRGNAKQWIPNARAVGVKTGSKPVPGAIVQFSGHGYNRYYGHVGIVADVTDDYIIVKDMNYRALNEVTIRKVPKDDEGIDGYIYID